MRSLKVRVFQLESKHHGTCQFCEIRVEPGQVRATPTSRYIYKVTIEREGHMGATVLRFCPMHLRDFYGQFRSGLLRLKRKKVKVEPE